LVFHERVQKIKRLVKQVERELFGFENLARCFLDGDQVDEGGAFEVSPRGSARRLERSRDLTDSRER